MGRRFLNTGWVVSGSDSWDTGTLFSSSDGGMLVVAATPVEAGSSGGGLTFLFSPVFGRTTLESVVERMVGLTSSSVDSFGTFLLKTDVDSSEFKSSAVEVEPG